MAGQVISKIVAGDGSKNLIANSFYGTCETAVSAVAKEVIINDPDIVTAITPIPGTMLTVKFSAANTATNPTLTLYNNSGSTTTPAKGATTLLAAKSIYKTNSTVIGATAETSWRLGALVSFVYDGTKWIEVTGTDENTTYTPMTASEATTGTATTGRAMTAAVLHGERASWYATTTVAATTTAKTATVTGYKLKAGTQLVVNFQNANTVTNAALTLNINNGSSNTGAKTICVNNAATSSSNQFIWDAGSDIEFIYDGTYYRVVSAPISSSEITAILDS